MGKITIVVSDFHLGAGEGDPLEDFTSDAAFARLLAELRTESEATGNPVHLLINGDFGEFLQVPARDDFTPGTLYPEAEYRPMTEAASLQKLALMVRGHPLLFDALRDWLRAEPPRRSLTILAGNHDPQFYWPSVRQRLRERLAATDETVAFVLAGWLGDGVYVEHGHQHAEFPNRFPTMEPPLAPDNPAELYLPGGSRFVLSFFNGVEAERPWIDGVKPITAMIWYGFQFDFVFAARAVAALIRALPGIVLARELAPPGGEESDGSAAARRILAGTATPAELRQWEQRYRRDATFKAQFDTAMARQLDAADATAPEAATGLTARTLDLPGMVRGQQEQLAQRSALVDAAERIAAQTGAQVVCFGHTHAAEALTLANGAHYINTGTWIWSGDFTSWTREQWADLFAHPEKYSGQRWLTYARIDHTADGTPTAARLLAVEGSAPAPGEGARGCLSRLFRLG